MYYNLTSKCFSFNIFLQKRQNNVCVCARIQFLLFPLIKCMAQAQNIVQTQIWKIANVNALQIYSCIGCKQQQKIEIKTHLQALTKLLMI